MYITNATNTPISRVFPTTIYAPKNRARQMDNEVRMSTLGISPAEYLPAIMFDHLWSRFFPSKISRFLLKFSFFEDSKCIFSDSLFPNDYLTFETDDEEIKIIANKKKGKKQIQIHSYLLDHQLFHQIIHSRTNCISDYSLSRVF